MQFGFGELRSLVIDRGLCTVCGTCVGICPQECLGMTYDGCGEPVPALTGECTSCGLCSKVCPGADVPLLELEKFCFGAIREVKPNDFGVFTSSYRGHATNNRVRRAGASGGVGTALLTHALESGLIDCALVAGFSRNTPWLAEARLATTPEELIEAAGSKYSPVAVNSLLHEAVKQGHERIGVVGCPCHIHGIRKMEYQGLLPNLTKRIKVMLGLFCARNWYLEGIRHLLAELCGIDDLQQVAKFQFRGRGYASPTNLVVELANGERREVPKEKYLPPYHHFTRDRCAMCIDWLAELADVSIGDYRRPLADPAEESTYSSILVRTPRGERWLKGAQEGGFVDLQESPADYLLDGGAFEGKKHGAVYRLARRQRYGWPTPNYHCSLSYVPFPTRDKSSKPHATDRRSAGNPDQGLRPGGSGGIETD